MYKVKVLDTREFRDCQETWNRLALSMNIPSIFCTWDWIYTWWERYGGNYEPLVLSITDGSEVKGILPLAFNKADTLKGRTLSYCGSNELYPDHLDIICGRQDAQECILSVFEFLSRDYKGWDVLNISLASEGGNLLEQLNGGKAGFKADIKLFSTAPFITLSGSFDEYAKRFTAKKRYNIRSSQKKLCSQFGMQYASCEQGEIEKGMETLFSLHAQRAEMKNIKSNFNRPDIREFHSVLAERINRAGWFCLRSLSSPTETIASMYCFVFGGRLFYYQIGFNPEWERYSPGTVLIYQVLEEAFSRGYREFDFLRGGEEYKSSWTDENRSLFSLSVYNNTLKAGITKTLSKSKDLLKSNIKRFID